MFTIYINLVQNIIKKKKIAKGLERMVLTGSCSLTPVLGVHGINKKSGSLGLKNRFSQSDLPVRSGFENYAPTVSTDQVHYHIQNMGNVHCLYSIETYVRFNTFSCQSKSYTQMVILGKKLANALFGQKSNILSSFLK